eukprot:GCRY01002852.1.p1 GENE.GCRY01002852.1~~GCRY01002852.1.p1  ORF type:complete len:239 (-),score=26.97 GCRY01002852.1:406-1122(-)
MSQEDHVLTLMSKEECFVYQLPPRTTASGYKAQDWDVSCFLWKGRIKVMSQGDECWIELEDVNSGQLFAKCPVNPDGSSVEPVTDSSRYFVLRIEDGSGRHAFIGMGFTERSDSFDFSCALSDHQKFVQRKKELSSRPAVASVDRSLQGETELHLKISSKGKAKPARSTPTPLFSGQSASGGLLPPPPSANSSRRGRGSAPKPAAQSAAAQSASPFDAFGAPSQQQPPSSSSSWDPFA